MVPSDTPSQTHSHVPSHARPIEYVAGEENDCTTWATRPGPVEATPTNAPSTYSVLALGSGALPAGTASSNGVASHERAFATLDHGRAGPTLTMDKLLFARSTSSELRICRARKGE